MRALAGEREGEALAALKDFRTCERQILRGEGQPQLVMDSEVLTPRVLIDLFSHGHYLHKGNDKSEKLARWPMADLTRFVFFSAIVQLRNLYLVAANVVRRILSAPSLTDVARRAA